jgi:hypothetical protein
MEKYGGYKFIAVLLFTLASEYVTVVSIVPDHQLSLVRDMGDHGGNPFQGVKDLVVAILFAYRKPDRLDFIRFL